MKTARVRLENGKFLSIEARDQSEKNVYVSRLELNGRALDRNYVTYSEIVGGGKS